MTESRRIKRVNALIQEAIADVILKDIKHPKISNLWVTVARVSSSKDLHTARVYISVMPHQIAAEEILEALQASSGFIAVQAAKRVFLRYFPELSFHLEDLFSPQDQIERVLWELHKEDRASN